MYRHTYKNSRQEIKRKQGQFTWNVEEHDHQFVVAVIDSGRESLVCQGRDIWSLAQCLLLLVGHVHYHVVDCVRCTHIRILTRHAFMCAHTHTHTYIHTYTLAHTHTHSPHIHACMDTHTLPSHTCMHGHTHTHTGMHTHTLSLMFDAFVADCIGK